MHEKIWPINLDNYENYDKKRKTKKWHYYHLKINKYQLLYQKPTDEVNNEPMNKLNYIPIVIYEDNMDVALKIKIKPLAIIQHYSVFNIPLIYGKTSINDKDNVQTFANIEEAWAWVRKQLKNHNF